MDEFQHVIRSHLKYYRMFKKITQWHQDWNSLFLMECAFNHIYYDVLPDGNISRERVLCFEDPLIQEYTTQEGSCFYLRRRQQV